MNKTKHFLIISLVAFFILLNYANARACTCVGSMSICGIYDEAEAVIVGKIENIEEARVTAYEENITGQKVKIKVIKSFKGVNTEFITLALPNTSCHGQYNEKHKEKEYLFYLDLNKKTNEYNIIICGRGGQTKDAGDDLSWLNNLPKSLERNRLSGVLKIFEDNSQFTFVDYLIGAKIKISGEKKSYELYTDKNGMFEIWDLPAGKYNVKAELPESLKLYFDMTGGAVEGDRNNYTVDMKPNGCAGINYILTKAK